MIAVFDLSILIGPAIGVVGIAVSAYLWRRGRVRPAISYRLTSAPVVNVNRQVEQRITVLYDGAPVSDVRLLDLRVTNTGNVDISPDKFEESLSVALGTKAKVLATPTVGKTIPPELRPRVTVDGNALVIAPLLLNAGDAFEVTALVSGLSEGDRLRARVAGVPKLVNVGTDPSERNTTWQRASAKASVAGAALSLVLSIAIVAADFRGRAQEHSLVVLRTGPPLCGDILRVNAKTVVLKTKGAGTLRLLPLIQTRAIRDKAC